MTDLLAVAALCHLPVRQIVEGDEIERSLWVAVALRASDLYVQLMKAQAIHNANQMALALRG